MKLFLQTVHLAADEWNNEIMLEVATELLNKPPQMEKDDIYVVEVYEHGGWWLQYAKIDSEIIVVGTANDAAVMPHKAKHLQERARGAESVYLPAIRR